MIAGLTVRAEYYNAPLHKCYKWPNLEELGVQVAETPLIPTIAKNVMEKTPKEFGELGFATDFSTCKPHTWTLNQQC